MKAVILQPSYIPWRGFFHQVQKAEIFVHYDCVQYDKHGWRNRNRIKTSQGSQWLTIPVVTKGCVKEGKIIKDIEIPQNHSWSLKHYNSIKQSYTKSAFYKEILPLVEEIYSRKDKMLVDFTCSTTEMIARKLGIQKTKFIRSSDICVTGSKTDRVIEILKKIGATHYISGPSAKDYIEKDKFADSGISLEFMSYDYTPYPQLHGIFEPRLSVLDLLFNLGFDAGKYIWGEK
tara:strand:+ start:1570 stop:2265 length:696 start_codon:yes stop_codon:yes gene_type:complete